MISEPASGTRRKPDTGPTGLFLDHTNYCSGEGGVQAEARRPAGARGSVLLPTPALKDAVEGRLAFFGAHNGLKPLKHMD